MIGAGRRRAGVADLLRLAVTGALLVLAWQLAGGSALLARVETLDWRWLLAGLLLSLPMQALSALRWHYTCARLQVPLRLHQALAEYYLASLLNALLPAGIAGDALRVWRHGRGQPGQGSGRYRGALHAVLIERSAGQLALALVVLAGIAAGPAALQGHAAGAGVLVMVALIAATAAALGVTAVLGAGSGRWRDAWPRLAQDAVRALWPASVLARQLAVSLLVVATYLGTFFAALAAVGQPLDVATTLVLVPLVLYAMAVPISVGGLGLRELSAGGLLGLIGLPVADGVLAGLLYWLLTVAGALPGAWLLLPGAAKHASSGSR